MKMRAINLLSAIDYTTSIIKVKSRLEPVIEKVAAKPKKVLNESPWPIHEYVRQDMSDFTVTMYFSSKPEPPSYIQIIGPDYKPPTFIPSDNPYDPMNEYFYAPNASRIGPYSDETVPQAYTSGLW